MTTVLYDTDFYRWTVKQVELLRNEDYAELDIANLIEEIEAMGRSQKKEIKSRLRVLLTHLLKLSYQPIGNPTRGWRVTIRDQRREIAYELEDSPSLRNYLTEHLQAVYVDARQDAADAVQMPVAVYPERCPWTPAQVLDIDFDP